MATTYSSITLLVNGIDYIFSVDATDGTETEMVNLVSGQSIGDTFPSSAVINAHGPLILNSSAGVVGASKSILGAVLVDPNNNVVFQIPYVDPETCRIPAQKQSNYPVGLNYQLKVLTTDA